ncbi:hypothetical protein [Niveibacterium sp. SC-1]|uniref:hypothetical protein n=1 Tax=Niveibacterium sp. SC-1 TaxID=3135646 RepID=UPI00311E96E2
MPSSAASPLLTAPQAEFIQRGLAIAVASRNARLVPSLARSFVCEVDPARSRVRILLLPSRSTELLRDIAASGLVAAVFVLPSTHETLQIKGTDARIEPLAEGDIALAQRSREHLANDLLKSSMNEEYVRQILLLELSEACAVSFTPSAVFLQTPGPGAGEAA